MASPAAQTDQLVRTFVAQLSASGVRHVVIAPGSRSTPLTLAFARAEEFTPWLHLDERSAGFFALGLARQLREPVAIVCTSGTAAANFAPAVFEASLSRVPLIVLTADRPPELRDVGANQTIDQSRVYGTHVKHAFEMPIADGSEALLRLARSTAARAAILAAEHPAAPVHVNFPFREPLTDATPPLPALPSIVRVAEGGAPVPGAATMNSLARAMVGKHGVIYCGPEPYGLPATEIVALAEALGWPILAEPLSGVRAGMHALDHVIDAYDPLLRTSRFPSAAMLEVVLRFGAAATSRPAMGFLAARDGLREIVVDVAGGWRDPEGSVATMVHADPAAFCRELRVSLAPAGKSTDPGWLALWSDANVAARTALREAVEGMDEPFEGRVPIELAEAVVDGTTLVVGNSMPVRDMESFFPVLGRDVRLVGTRGASGIDGVVSTAAGAAAAKQGRVLLLIGDLSFFHDMNGLWALKRHGLSLTVLLVNNDGGGIFHFLPQAQDAPKEFEEWFGTPHGLDFSHAVALHGGRYERLEGTTGWAARIAAALAEPGLTVLEVQTDRVRNVLQHREVWARVETSRRECHRWADHGIASRGAMTRIDAGGLMLNVEVAGQGPPVVLLHGFTGSARGWARVANILGAEFTTLAFDIVGHGQSDAPEALDHYWMSQVVDDLVALLRRVGYERAAWLGYSMGGRTALQVAVHHPEAVSALILEGASPGLRTELERRERVAGDEVLAERLEQDGVQPFIDYWQAIPLFASHASLPRDVWDAQRAGRLANSARGLANSLRGMGTGSQEALHDRLREIQVPVLVSAGEFDTRYTAVGEEMAAVLPDATMHVISGGGHAAHLEQPDRFGTLVLEFLRRVVGTTSSATRA